MTQLMKQGAAVQLPVFLWLKVGIIVPELRLVAVELRLVAVELRLGGKVGTLEVVTAGFRGLKLG